MKIRIACIIPTHNRKIHLKNILIKLGDQLNIHIFFIGIIVIADNCIDGTNEMVEDEFPNVNLIKHFGKDLWYTNAMNIGFKQAYSEKYDYVLTLNDDIDFDKNYLSTLVESSLLLKETAIIGSISITDDICPKVLFAGVNNYKLSGLRPQYSITPLSVNYSNNLSGIHITKELPGRGMLIPVIVLSKLKFFDKKFPQYGSDTDFCFRARKNGVNIFISYDSVVKTSIKLTRINYINSRNKFIKKIKNILNIHSHESIRTFLLFHYKHYNLLSLIWKLPYFFLKVFLK